jgi:prophage antirepressor-like protein
MQLHLELVTFEYQHRLKVRTFGTPDNPTFAASDICSALGLENVSQALNGMDKDDITNNDVTDSIGRKQSIKCVTEAGLYQLIFKSTKSEAQEFKRWVTKEVLPQIRKTGGFGRAKSIPAFVRRFNANWHRVENGFFSVISELYIRVHGKFEQFGCTIADKARDGKEIRPDVSVGQLFSKYLKLYHPQHVSRRKKYSHVFDDGMEVEAWQYPIDVLPIFIEYVETIWLKEHAPDYLNKRDPAALPFLAKILPAIKPAVRIAR